MESVLALGHELFVGWLGGFGCCEPLLVVFWSRDGQDSGVGSLGVDVGNGSEGAAGGGCFFFVILDDSVVGDVGGVSLSWSGTLEECGAMDEHPPFDGAVFLDDFRMDIGDEE